MADLKLTRMAGPRKVRLDLMAWFEAHLPPLIVRTRTDWSLSDVELPDFEEFKAYEKFALDRAPLIQCGVTRATEFTRTDVLDGEPQYDLTYQAQVWAWVKAQDYEPTLEMRDDVGTIIRAMLLGDQAFGQPNRYAMNERSFSEDYSEPAKVKGDRWVAGIVYRFDLRVSEGLARVPIGTVDTTEVETDLLPVHPAMI